MKAIEAVETGGPETLALVERPEPSAGPGEVLLRVRLAGVNFMDVHMRRGTEPAPFPLIPGVEGVGTVEATGEGVGSLSVGQRVAYPFAMRPGAYAELHAVPRCPGRRGARGRRGRAGRRGDDAGAHRPRAGVLGV